MKGPSGKQEQGMRQMIMKTWEGCDYWLIKITILVKFESLQGKTKRKKTFFLITYKASPYFNHSKASRVRYIHSIRVFIFFTHILFVAWGSDEFKSHKCLATVTADSAKTLKYSSQSPNTKKNHASKRCKRHGDSGPY